MVTLVTLHSNQNLIISYSTNEDKNSLELKVPDYYLEMDLVTIKQYCKLAKVSQGDKHMKAVAAYIKSDFKKKPRKTSMSVNAKAFFPKANTLGTKPKSGSFDCAKDSEADTNSTSSDSGLDPNHIL